MTLQEILDRVLNTLEEDKALADDMQSAGEITGGGDMSVVLDRWLSVCESKKSLADDMQGMLNNSFATSEEGGSFA